MNGSLAGMGVCAAAVILMVSPWVVSADDGVDFREEIWPLLHERCHVCHGEKVQEGGLRLDIKEVALGVAKGSAIVPGKTIESELIRRVTTEDPNETMPPKGQRLSAEEVRRLSHWIDSGAPWPNSMDQKKGSDPDTHWAWVNQPRPRFPPQR